ncbi:MAG: glycosyltransferase family 2 protein [Rhodospirillaceae bacterium]
MPFELGRLTQLYLRRHMETMFGSVKEPEIFAENIVVFLKQPSAEFLVQFAHHLKEAGFLNQAAQAYAAAITADPADPDPRLHLGHLLKRLNKRDQALRLFLDLWSRPDSPYVLPEINGLLVAQQNQKTSLQPHDNAPPGFWHMPILLKGICLALAWRFRRWRRAEEGPGWRFFQVAALPAVPPDLATQPPPLSEQYRTWVEATEVPSETRPESQMDLHETIGFLLDCRGADPIKIDRTLKSLSEQTSANYQILCLVSEGAEEVALFNRSGSGSKTVTLALAPENSIAAARNAAVDGLQADFVAVLEPGDTVAPLFCQRVAEAFTKTPGQYALYCDDDIQLPSGARTDPHFKPAWNKEYFYCYDYIGRAVVISHAALKEVGAYRALFPGQETYDLILRLARRFPEGIGHLPAPLWHHENRLPPCSPVGPVADILRDHAIPMTVSPGHVVGTAKLVWSLPKSPPLVTLIIPTRDRADLLETAVSSILEKTTYPAYEIIIVDNGSVESKTQRYFSEVQTSDRVSILRDEGDFNFSRLNNRAAEKANGTVLGLINNDVEVITPNWLSEMVSPALDKETGAVGAKLLYGSGHIQHAGVVGGIGVTAGHGHKYYPDDAAGYMNRLAVQQSILAVTGACLIVEREKYRAVGGLDEENFKVAFNDVDLCLKLSEQGWRTVFTPWACLYHHESLSRGLDLDGRKAARFHMESNHMTNKWGQTLLEDRFYNPGLTKTYEDFSLSIVDAH